MGCGFSPIKGVHFNFLFDGFLLLVISFPTRINCIVEFLFLISGKFGRRLNTKLLQHSLKKLLICFLITLYVLIRSFMNINVLCVKILEILLSLCGWFIDFFYIWILMSVTHLVHTNMIVISLGSETLTRLRIIHRVRFEILFMNLNVLCVEILEILLSLCGWFIDFFNTLLLNDRGDGR